MKEIAVVAAILKYEDEILCMQKGEVKFAYMSYKYEFPGGKIEPSETPEIALQRELKEELAINVMVHTEDFFMEVDYTYPDFRIKMKTYLCPVTDKNFVMKEHFAFKWLPKEQLAQLAWAEADKAIVKKLA
ncbi:MAG: (deoxy)nucleoside triphosphate pyrophosphohydrolase, partial [Acidaminococcaceae bacterium]